MPAAVLTKPWSDEVEKFAAEKGVDQFLPAVWEMTTQMFPSALRTRLYVEEDPEIADQKYLVVDVEIAGLSDAEYCARQQSWVRRMLVICPPPIDSPFILRLFPLD